jgi:hypothetical protein
MVEILINNRKLEVQDKEIKYTKQCNDISELGSRECNYTSAFSIPKTPSNTLSFRGLGIVGDVSDAPYKKIDCKLLDSGFCLINKGWLNVKQTAKDYKTNINDGLIDLFKAIENKNFGDHVDLSEINHQKNVTTIINSFTNDNYRYIINDFGGLTHLDNGTKINADYLIPSVRIKYLWDKIFSTFGFEYSGDFFLTDDFINLWITYPKGNEQTEPTLYAEFLETDGTDWTTINIVQGNVYNDVPDAYVVPETGTYLLYCTGTTFVAGADKYDFDEIYFNYIFVNNVYVGSADEIPFNNNGWTVNLKAGEIVSLYNEVGITQGNLIIKKFDTDINFSEEFKNLEITKFFKDILNAFSLTIFVTPEGVYNFKTFDERLQADVIDWTDKYAERTSETYTPKTYAQKNTFVHEYNDKEVANYNDGFFNISNQNLNEKKEIVKSYIFAHDKAHVKFYINSNHSEVLYPTLLWQKEANENNGTQTIKYKGLENRFYYLRTDTINQNAIIKGNETEQLVSSLPIARFIRTNFKDLIPKYYRNIKTLLDSFRMHKIKLAINKFDFINLDFDKIYYFKQEQGYYILNKLTFENGKISDAEFFRIKYTESEFKNREYSQLDYNDNDYSTNLI